MRFPYDERVCSVLVVKMDSFEQCVGWSAVFWIKFSSLG